MSSNCSGPIDLETLPENIRKRVDRALRPNDVVFSRRFNGDDIEGWKLAAQADGKSLKFWIETTLNRIAAEQKEAIVQAEIAKNSGRKKDG